MEAAGDVVRNREVLVSAPPTGRDDRERGAVLVLFAIGMTVLMSMLALSLDLSYGFVQDRRAQNASDFAAYGAAQQLNGSTICNGSATAPNMQELVAVVQALVDANSSDVGTSWTAHFLDEAGNAISGSAFSPASASTSTYPPPGACGVAVDAVPKWAPFFAGIFNVHQLTGKAKTSVAVSTPGTAISLIALNKVGPHVVLGGGTGRFVVSGDMQLNTDVSNQPWSTEVSPWEFDDAIDAKTGSNLFVFGTIHTTNATITDSDGNVLGLWPLDQCFAHYGAVGEGIDGTSDPAFGSGVPPTNTLSCSDTGKSVTLDYNHIDPTVAPIDDPLQSPDAPPNPFSPNTDIACPGMTAQTYSTSPSSGVLMPGEYTAPVQITGTATFDDCSGYPGEAAYPGIYRFDQGLWIDPQATGDTVTGSNVVIATQAPYDVAGNTPPGGHGNGGPCLPAGTMTSVASADGNPAGEPEVDPPAAPCGTSPQTYGVIAYGDSSFAQDDANYGTGNNFSLMVGGVAGTTVSFTAPTTGTYGGASATPGVAFYQDPNTEANDGFDAEPADAAVVKVTGLVYNASLSDYGKNAPLDYWDGVGGGIPFYAGGTLQGGYGAGWSDGPPQSGGSVTIDGTCIVDQFNTDGATSMTILGKSYALPGAGKLSFVG